MRVRKTNRRIIVAIVLVGTLLVLVAGWLNPDKRPQVPVPVPDSISDKVASKISSKLPAEYFKEGDFGPLETIFLARAVTQQNLHMPVIQQKLAALRSFDKAIGPPKNKLNVTRNPLDIIADRFPTGAKFQQLSRKERARYYVDEVLPETEYEFRPMDNSPEDGMDNALGKMENGIAALYRLRKAITDEDLETMQIDSPTLESFIVENYRSKVAENNKASDYATGALDHIRLFSSIFLKDTESFRDDLELVGLCNKAAEKLFPWFSEEYPIYTTYNRNMEPTRIYPFSDNPDLGCFIKSLQTVQKGRGITVSIADKFVPNLLGLISVLRAQDKQPLPIELFYWGPGDLSQKSIEKIVQRATEPINTKHPDAPVPLGINTKAPPLEVRFVDVSGVVTKNYRSKFGGFGNKLLAYLFTTFEDMVLMDADTVPLVQMNEFFETDEYKRSKTLFFRDRELGVTMLGVERDFMVSLLNGRRQYEYLGLQRGRYDVLKNRMFKYNSKYLMEAGLVPVNRKINFDAVLTASMLNMIGEVRAACWGDKEMFWLSHEYMGDFYMFNKHPCGAVGELEPQKNKDRVAHTLCSTHPSHFGDDAKRVLWINSGFQYCKNNAWGRDSKLDKFKDSNEEEIKKSYLAPLKIVSGVIPPPPYNHLDKVKDEPGAGWDMAPQCDGYMWCANDIIGGQAGLTDVKVPKGKMVTFSKMDQDRYSYLGQVWTDYHEEGAH